jgi:ABC-2 type transport system ATP-binding protein
MTAGGRVSIEVDTGRGPTSDGTSPHGGIIVSDVKRSFGAVHAVRDASFEAHPGSVTALIGPNGSGKTTLMLMLASLLAPQQGSIRVAGFDPVAQPREVRRRLGWMPDALGSWGALTVRQALTTTAALYGMPRDEASGRTEELLHIVDLVPLADQASRSLSRGQKQRLSLARAIVHDPSVLVLDEPASGLDPGARASLRELVRQFAGQGKTVLVSSHVLAELDEMADAAVYIEQGATVSAERVAQARSGLRDWRIRATSAGTPLGHALLALGLPASHISADNLGTLVKVGGDEQAARLLTDLVGRGVSISAFAPAVGELEHTFLDITDRGGRR